MDPAQVVGELSVEMVSTMPSTKPFLTSTLNHQKIVLPYVYGCIMWGTAEIISCF